MCSLALRLAALRPGTRTWPVLVRGAVLSCLASACVPCVACPLACSRPCARVGPGLGVVTCATTARACGGRGEWRRCASLRATMWAACALSGRRHAQEHRRGGRRRRGCMRSGPCAPRRRSTRMRAGSGGLRSRRAAARRCAAHEWAALGVRLRCRRPPACVFAGRLWATYLPHCCVASGLGLCARVASVCSRPGVSRRSRVGCVRMLRSLAAT